MTSIDVRCQDIDRGSGMELRHLRYFVTVAETLHFGRAAQQLRIAQPSLSHQILQLENELQTKLFERSTKRVRLTAAGHRLLQESRQILEHVDRAALITRAGPDSRKERLRIAFGYWTDVGKVCLAIQRFTETHSDVHVELHNMNVPQQIAALREERIDMGFVRPPVTDSMLSTEFLVSDTFRVAVSKKHRLAHEKHIAIHDLRDESIIMPPRDRIPVFYDITLKLFNDAGFVPKVNHEVDYPTMVLGLVSTGVGVALVPTSVSRFQNPGITFVPLQPVSRVLETALAWRRDGVSETLKDFLQIARETIAARKRATKTVLGIKKNR
jgi:DNA-binding transcriptional LysR family regulator